MKGGVAMKEKKPINIEIGQRVKQCREDVGLTQEKLAELIDLGDKHISAIECGAAGVSLPVLRRLCKVLSVSADKILFGVEEEEPQDKRAAEVHVLGERLSRLSDYEFDTAREILDKILDIFAERR